MSTVLVVDDNVDLGNAVVALAKASGCEGIAAQSVPEALAILRERAIDLVFLDYHMPEMSGLDFLKDLRARGVKTTAPVVVMCSADDDVRQDALAYGAVQFISKDRKVWSQIAEALDRYAGCVLPK